MDELWGIKSVLDSVDDVALVIISEREETILYCNHLATLKTGVHAGGNMRDLWRDYDSLLRQCGDSRTMRLYAARTPFGDNKNVTVTRIVWQGAKQAISFMVTAHVEDSEEKDKELIFKSLGQSYLSMYSLNIYDWKISMLLRSETADLCFYQPLDFEQWKNNIYLTFIHPDDYDNVKSYFEKETIKEKLDENHNRFSFQYRRKFEDEYRWTELRFCRIKELANDNRIICTERDIQGEMNLNRSGMENELIMQSISNVYRSVYLLDRMTGEYETVKPDELLFGIPREGDYSVLMDIVEELIPDKRQKKDFREYFALEALDNAFLSGSENIGREYNSTLTKDLSWMSISAFRPPRLQDLENKCVLTFMDITEHKRVEAERNENNIVIDVLSSRYMAVFFAKLLDGSFHSIKVPRKYGYVEKQFSSFRDALAHYTAAYVLDEYKDLLKRVAASPSLLLEENEGNMKKEYLYRNIDNRWIRLNVFRVPGDNVEPEAIVAFEDYNDIMNQNSLSLLYSSTMLADYDGMYEYDPENDAVYTLVYDGERLVRKVIGEQGQGFESLNQENEIHPDDAEIFRVACSKETVEGCVLEGKTVSHLYIRRKKDNDYHMFMYGFHYFEEFGNKRVLIMARDADKEIV